MSLIPPRGYRRRFDASVEVNRPLCREHFLLRLRIAGGGAPPAFPPTRPGQFIQLGCRPPGAGDFGDDILGRDLEWTPEGAPGSAPGSAPGGASGGRPAVRQVELLDRMALLRRPFSLAGRGDDAQGTWIEVIHRVVGGGTAWLSRLEAGDAVDLLGPLGNAFTLPADKSIGLLVGGGVGLPPMFYLAEALRDAGWRAVGFVGATSRDLLAVQMAEGTAADCDGVPTACVAEFARLGFPAVVTTDDASCGLPGRITAGVERYLQTQSAADAAHTVVFTCGPEPMMHAVARLAQGRDIPCQVCVEQAMACGMGTCQSCIVRIEESDRPQAVTPQGRPWRYRLACTDGPVFDSRAVVWG